MSPSRRSALVGAAACVVVPARAVERLRATDLWTGGGRYSEKAEKTAGHVVTMRGYMAPPLKAEARFFVLTRIPMSVCPFCDTEASWPDDLVLVEMKGAFRPVDFNDLVEVTGRLDIGTKTDPETGFVSRARLVEASFARV